MRWGSAHAPTYLCWPNTPVAEVMNTQPAAQPGSSIPSLEYDGRPLLQLEPMSLFGQLQHSGALLLRGFASTLEEFQQFSALLVEQFHRVGTRRAVDDEASDGHTSEVPVRNFNLFVHSEGHYRPVPPPPDLCFFNCVIPPAGGGGETLLADGVRFLELLPGPLRRRFEEQGVIYEALWDTPRWQTEFRVESLAELDELMARNPQCSYQPQGEEIRVRCRMAAIQTTLGGLRAFANGLLAHLPAITHPRWKNRNAYARPSNRVYFGDGEEISGDVLNPLIDIQDELVVAHAWRQNDLLVLDNSRYMHGRRMTESDCERKIRSRFGQLRKEFRALASHAA